MEFLQSVYLLGDFGGCGVDGSQSSLIASCRFGIECLPYNAIMNAKPRVLIGT